MSRIKHQPKLDRVQVAKILRSQGITPTRQRVKIASILLAPRQHLSALELMELVNRNSEAISKATIYNTVGLFTRKGLVHEVIVDPANVYYDSNVRHHHHFYNIITSTLIDIPEEQIIINQLPNLPDGTVLQGIDVTIRLRNSSP